MKKNYEVRLYEDGQTIAYGTKKEKDAYLKKYNYLKVIKEKKQGTMIYLWVI